MSDRGDLVSVERGDGVLARFSKVLNDSVNEHPLPLEQVDRLHRASRNARDGFDRLEICMNVTAGRVESASYRVIEPLYSVYEALDRLHLYDEFIERAVGRVHGNAKYRAAALVRVFTESRTGWQLDASNRSHWAAILDYGLKQGWSSSTVIEQIKAEGGIAACAAIARADAVKKADRRCVHSDKIEAFIRQHRSEILSALGLPERTCGRITVTSTIEVRVGDKRYRCGEGDPPKTRRALSVLRDVLNGQKG